jgi:hypothetical protein
MADTDDVDTWDMPVHFKVRQAGDGSLWILIEQLRPPTLPILDAGFLGLELAKGTTTEQIEKLAQLLDERVTNLTYTGPNRGAWIDNPGRRARAKRRRHDT